MGMELVLAGPRRAALIRHFRLQHEAVREREIPADSTPFDAQLLLAAEAARAPVDVMRKAVETLMFERPARYLRLFRRTRLLGEISAFRARGGRTAIISDYPAEGKLVAMNVRDLFDIVVANGDLESPRRMKPDPDGMLRAAALLRVPPDRCLVIGDRDDADGGAARAAGMGFRKVG
jgi:HAD superfamily hydrolase (TIGR01509 family)